MYVVPAWHTKDGGKVVVTVLMIEVDRISVLIEVS
jgi:hypothetical protein